MSWTHVDKNGKIIGNGIAFEILNILSKKLNFTYDVVVPENNIEIGESAQQDSLLGMLNDHKIDMAAAFIAISPHYLRYNISIKFSQVLDKARMVMMYNKSTSSTPSFHLRTPFQNNVWIALLLSLFWYFVCLVLLTRLRSKFMNDEEEYFTALSSISYMYRVCTKQDIHQSPKSSMTRIMLAAYYIFIMLVSTYYTTKLTANLTLNDFAFPIKSLEDLMSHDVSWATRKGGSVEHFLIEKITSNTFKDLIQREKVQIFNQNSRRISFKKYLRKHYAIIDEYYAVKNYMYNNYREKKRLGHSDVDSCDIVIAPYTFTIHERAFAYPMNTTLKVLFDSVLSGLSSNGIMNTLHRRYIHVTVCSKSRNLKKPTLNLYSMRNIVYFFGTGTLLALVVFIFEVSIKRKSKQTLVIENNKIQRRRSLPNNLLVVRDYEDAEIRDSTSSDESVRFRRIIVNGRLYLVGRNSDGETRLIPINTPSALPYNLNLYEAIL